MPIAAVCMRRGFLAWAALAGAFFFSPVQAQTPPAENPAANDPLLQPPVDYTLPGPGQPLPASETRLEQLLSLAATDSPTMRQQAAAVAQVDASRFRSWVRQMPVLNATYSLGLFYQANTGNGNKQDLVPGGAFVLEAKHPLFYWGAFRAETALGILKEQIAQNEALIAYAQLCLDVRKKYYALVVQKAQLDLLTHQAESAQRRLEKERIQFDHGHSTAARINQLDLAGRNFAVQQANAANSLQFQIGEFRRLAGSRSFTVDDIPDHLYLPVVDQSDLQSQYQDFQKDGFDRSSTARAAALNEVALDKKIIINDSRQKPLFDMSASVSQTPYTNTGNTLKFNTILFVGVSGSWDIFDRYETRDATRALLVERRLNESRLKDSREQAFDDALNSLNQIDLGLRSLAILKRQLAQSQDDYKRIQILQSTGHTERTETDAARDALLDAKFQILSKQAEVASAYYSFISDIFRDPALAHAPSFTESRGP